MKLQVTSLLLGIGIGAGFALSVELKKFLEDKVKDISPDHDFNSTYYKILIRGFVASAFLLVTFLSMTAVSFISSNNRSKRK